LSGNDILDAKIWVARRPKGAPEPTALHLDFIRASEDEAETRLSEQRKQLEAMAAAQAERETALHDREEALKQRARVARVRNIALVAVSILFVLAAAGGAAATWSYVLAQRQTQITEQQKQIAEQQKQIAEQQKEQADEILNRAITIIVNLQNRMDVQTQQEVFALLTAGARRGDAAAMRYLAWAYVKGVGVTQDYAKAREWFEKSAAKVEAEETKRDGKPGKQTAGQLTLVSWYALFAKEFTKALTVSLPRSFSGQPRNRNQPGACTHVHRARRRG
jgi:Sel1 repeat